jgi:hypothetical protein
MLQRIWDGGKSAFCRIGEELDCEFRRHTGERNGQEEEFDARATVKMDIDARATVKRDIDASVRTRQCSTRR